MPLLDNFRAKTGLWRELGPFFGAVILALALFFGLSIFTGGLAQRGKVLENAADARAELEKAYAAFAGADFKGAGEYFKLAGQSFAEIDKSLNGLSNALEPVGPGRISEGLKLARAGRSISSAGYFFSRGLDSLSSLAPEFTKIVVLDRKTLAEPAPSEILPRVKSAFADFSWSSEFMRLAAGQAGNLPVGDDINKLRAGVSAMADFTSILGDVLKPKSTVLLIFQNNAEARPGGGFIGSYGRLRLGRDNIESLLIESIYQIDGQLREKIAPPKPLRLVAGDAWAMRDSNWWPDFKVSAAKISEFYEKEAGETPDAIVAFTPDVFEGLVEILGPVPMPQYGVVLDKSNFYDVIQRQTSEEYDKQLNRPKKFIADLAAAMLARLPELPAHKKIGILGLFLSEAGKKNILFWSRDAGTQGKIENLGLGGRLAVLNGYSRLDDILISNANVGGGKSDRYIITRLAAETTVQEGGRIVNKLTINRENRSPADVKFPNNINYQRIYVPLGSTLLRAGRDVDVFEELGRTVFASTMTLRPGETSELVISYQLPFKAGHSYSLLVEKNPGQKIDNFVHRLVLPEGSKIIHNIGDPNGGPVDSNKFLGFVF